jgi:predicted Zn-dependent protease
MSKPEGLPLRRYLPIAFFIASGVLGIVYVQHEHIDMRPSAQPPLTAAADAQRELTRGPMKFDRLSDADEIEIGNEMAKAATSLGAPRADRAHDAAAEAYLQFLGSRVAEHARRKLPWTFHYIPSPEFVNAFALPGGHVFVGEGLLRLVASEDALAAVLGHEVEHIDLRHCAERAQAQARLRQMGSLGDFAGIPVELFMAGYSKEEELEADRDGTTLAVQNGYSYTGIIDLLHEFKKREKGGNRIGGRPEGPLSEAAQLSVSTLSDYFASHPPSEQRAERIRELALERGWSAKPLRRLAQGDETFNSTSDPSRSGPPRLEQDREQVTP